MKCFVPIVVSFFTFSTIAGTAFADQDDDARSQYQRGKELFQEGKYTEAAIAFQRAYELRPSFKLLYNIGQVENENGEYARALDAYTRYLEEGDGEIAADRKAIVDKEIARLKSLVGTIKVVGADDGAVLMVDGQRFAEAPFDKPVMVKLGEREVVVKSSGQELFTEILRVAGGKELVVEVEVATTPDPAAHQPESQPAPSRVTDTADSSRGLKTGGIIALALGGAAAIGAGITGGLALSKKNKLEDTCPANEEGNNICPPTQSKQLESARGMATVSTIMTVVAGVGITTGVILLVVGVKKSEKSPVRVSATTTSEGAGFMLTGRF
ncbi:MAG: tetratricopeptide repeat protein [Proteobacteria bacterium]|nr:tetratricopeptide repeat protein [Pseudomonadota bacterium]